MARVPLLVAVGGFAGGLARYGLTLLFPAPGTAFPWTVVAINTAGAFLLAMVVSRARPAWLVPLLGVGACGAFTTFSTIVVDGDRMLAAGHLMAATTLIMLSVATGLAAAALGLSFPRRRPPVAGGS